MKFRSSKKPRRPGERPEAGGDMAFFQLIRTVLKSSRLLTQLSNLAIGRRPSNQFWTWEVYGLGIATKSVLGVPQRKVLALGSDHGVNLTTVPDEMEESLSSDAYVTWSHWRAGLNFANNRQVIAMQHPWVSYRKKIGISLSDHRAGTLAFVPHTVPGMKTEDFNIHDYVSRLLSLPKTFHPITLCLHVHDVSVKRILDLTKQGVAVETVGHSLSPHYVKRFYSLARNFRYATSPIIGSQLFYMQEFGVDYFLFNPSSYQGKLLGYRGPALDATLTKNIELAFSLENVSQASEEKSSIIQSAMGINYSDASSENIRTLLLARIPGKRRLPL